MQSRHHRYEITAVLAPIGVAQLDRSAFRVSLRSVGAQRPLREGLRAAYADFVSGGGRMRD